VEVVFYDDADERTLKEMADKAMPPVDVISIPAFELLHEVRDIGVRGQHDEMEMRPHLLAAQDLNPVVRGCFDQQVQEPRSIAIIVEDETLSIAAIHDVVGAAVNQ
jgi:hypothetical protein